MKLLMIAIFLGMNLMLYAADKYKDLQDSRHRILQECTERLTDVQTIRKLASKHGWSDIESPTYSKGYDLQDEIEFFTKYANSEECDQYIKKGWRIFLNKCDGVEYGTLSKLLAQRKNEVLRTQTIENIAVKLVKSSIEDGQRKVKNITAILNEAKLKSDSGDDSVMSIEQYDKLAADTFEKFPQIWGEMVLKDCKERILEDYKRTVASFRGYPGNNLVTLVFNLNRYGLLHLPEFDISSFSDEEIFDLCNLDATTSRDLYLSMIDKGFLYNDFIDLDDFKLIHRLLREKLKIARRSQLALTKQHNHCNNTSEKYEIIKFS